MATIETHAFGRVCTPTKIASESVKGSFLFIPGKQSYAIIFYSVQTLLQHFAARLETF